MAASNDKTLELIIKANEFLTQKVEELDARIRSIEIGQAASSSKMGAFVSIAVFFVGILGSLITHVITKKLWP